MATEISILSWLVKSREAYNTAVSALSSLEWSPLCKIIVQDIGDIYTSSDVDTIDVSVLIEICSLKHENPAILEILNKVEKNPKGDVLLLIKEYGKHNLRDQIVSAIVQKKEKDIVAACKKYLDSNVDTSTEAQKAANFEQELDDLVVATAESNLIKLYPVSLNKYLGGGIPKESACNILVFARPETGKSATCITLAYGFCKQGLTVVYVENEWGTRAFMPRILTRFASDSTDQVDWTTFRKDQEKYFSKAKKAGLDLLRYYEGQENSLEELESFVVKEKAQVLIVDQMLNIMVDGESNSSRSLGVASRGIREIGRRHGIITICATQAGKMDFSTASPQEGRSLISKKELYLRKEDVYMSNTEVPGAYSLMLGIGTSEEYKRQNRIMISICKNQLGSVHTALPAKIYPFSSMVLSV